MHALLYRCKHSNWLNLKMAKIIKAKDQLLVAELLVTLVPCMSSSLVIYGHVDGSVLLSFSCLAFAMLNYFVQIAFLSSPMMPRAAIIGRSRLLTVEPRIGRRHRR
jgi:hypothetical protein